MTSFEFGFILFMIWLCSVGVILVVIVGDHSIMDHIDALYTPSPTPGVGS